MILNLKSFNQHIEYQHFKMDSVWTAIRLMTPSCYMASIDLKDAYYSVPIAESHQKYLKFEWKNMLYQFTCFPNGLAFCPRKFTKLMKPVFATLRQLGHLSSGYIDDSWGQSGMTVLKMLLTLSNYWIPWDLWYILKSQCSFQLKSWFF